MNQKRYNFKCEESEFAEFIKKLNSSGRFIYRNHTPATHTVMQSRYTYTCEGCRVSVVYETKAKTLIFTAPGEVMQELVDIYNGRIVNKQNSSALAKSTMLQVEADMPKTDNRTLDKLANIESVKSADDKTNVKFKETVGDDAENKGETSTKPQTNKQRTKQSIKAKKTSTGSKSDNKVDKKQSEVAKNTNTAVMNPSNNSAKQSSRVKSRTNVSKSENSNADKPDVKAKTAKRESETMSPPVRKGTKNVKSNRKELYSKSSQVVKESDKVDQNKNEQRKSEKTFTIKKFGKQRAENVLTAIKENKRMRLKQTYSDPEVSTYYICEGKDKASLRVDEEKIMLSGAKSRLFDEIQLIISQACDYKTAISTHIKLAGEEKRAFEIERQLRKKLPDAYDLLGEQARIDFAIGVIDIDNSTAVLYDYSTLLIPCFRGLERFIFDLQRAQGIEVKMIGQAYEKENGSYVLKSGYRRKIPFVVYAEVMAALYTEYNSQRNFYAHSDGLDEKSRIITDRAQVKEIFNQLMREINYNGKKLKEIGFSI